MKTKARPTRGNPSMLTLLEMGATITFPDEAEFHGVADKNGGYIEIRAIGCYMGRYILNKNGLQSALNDHDLKDACKED